MKQTLYIFLFLLIESTGSAQNFYWSHQAPEVQEVPVECYGYLYNWYAVVDAKKITSSDDFIVPGWEDFYTLRKNIEPSTFYYNNTVGKKLKITGDEYWTSPNNGTNSYGFNAKGSGYRYSWYGFYSELKKITYFWNNGEYISDSTYGDYTSLRIDILQSGSTGTGDWMRMGYRKNGGCSVRLVRNSTSLINGETGIYVGNDGKVYNTICIGTQEWLSENLEETQYRNGDPIYWIKDDTEWINLTTGACCMYNNDTTYACKRPLPVESPYTEMVAGVQTNSSFITTPDPTINASSDEYNGDSGDRTNIDITSLSPTYTDSSTKIEEPLSQESPAIIITEVNSNNIVGILETSNAAFSTLKLIKLDSDAVNLEDIVIEGSDNGYTAVLVNHILVELDSISSGGYIGRKVFLSGTNAAPDSSSGGYDGLAAKASLESKGFTVTTN